MLARSQSIRGGFSSDGSGTGAAGGPAAAPGRMLRERLKQRKREMEQVQKLRKASTTPRTHATSQIIPDSLTDSHAHLNKQQQ